MKYAIVTGASRGLGLEVTKKLIERDYRVITVARNQPNVMTSNDIHISGDLSNLDEVKRILNQIQAELVGKSIEELVVINNAGTINPIGPVGTLNDDDIIKHMNVNIISLMLIVNTIVKEIKCEQSLFVNITSGAAERSVYGWNTYCTSKAAVNMFTQTTALEAEERKRNELHIAFSPGIMDTDMQGEIRSTNEEDFIEVEKFRKYKEEGQLRSPEEVARILFKLIDDRSKLKNGEVYRVYDLVK